MIAFVSSIIANVNGLYPKYSWWCVAYMLMVIVGVIATFVADRVDHYQIAVSRVAPGRNHVTTDTNRLRGFWQQGWS